MQRQTVLYVSDRIYKIEMLENGQLQHVVYPPTANFCDLKRNLVEVYPATQLISRIAVSPDFVSLPVVDTQTISFATPDELQYHFKIAPPRIVSLDFCSDDAFGAAAVLDGGKIIAVVPSCNTGNYEDFEHIFWLPYNLTFEEAVQRVFKAGHIIETHPIGWDRAAINAYLIEDAEVGEDGIVKVELGEDSVTGLYLYIPLGREIGINL